MAVKTEEQTAAKLPDSVVLNGVTYKVSEVPELQQFIAQVSQVEKAKLHSKFESLQEKLSVLSSQAGSVSLTPFDLDTILDKIREVIPTKETIEETVKNIVQPLLLDSEGSRKQSIEDYKAQLLEDNKGTCFPELVKGDTKEAIDNSLAESKALWAKYPSDRAVQGAPGATVEGNLSEYVQSQKSTQEPIRQEGGFYVPNRESPNTLNGTNIKGMSQEDFAKNRDALKAEIEASLK